MSILPVSFCSGIPFPAFSKKRGKKLSGLFEKRPRRKTLIGCAPAFLKKGFGEKLYPAAPQTVGQVSAFMQAVPQIAG
ncbi:hypothetical protein [Anaerotruncus colihominis]|uniref:hypothetical protein n=1 Tax=Anaerotruncus colihominis TaxID=169435 RepID=UPI0012DF87D3|nr:hypothetical protein [Anaerotruncus colihominis]